MQGGKGYQECSARTDGKTQASERKGMMLPAVCGCGQAPVFSTERGLVELSNTPSTPMHMHYTPACTPVRTPQSAAAPPSLQCVNTFTGYNCTCGHGFLPHAEPDGTEVGGWLVGQSARALPWQCAAAACSCLCAHSPLLFNTLRHTQGCLHALSNCSSRQIMRGRVLQMPCSHAGHE